MAGEMLFIANLGVAAIRMDATPFLWKEPGTTSENRPEAHLVLQALRLIADLACPSVVFLSEAIVHPDDVASYVNHAECQLGYNPLLMTAVWDALATNDVRFLAKALESRFELPAGGHWLTYLRSHDDIGWGFADEDALQMAVDPALHRRFLNEFYAGKFPGSFARGELFQHHPPTGDARISGSLASLAGLEAALLEIDPKQTELAVGRILAAFAVVLFTAGIPLIMIGDETATLSDHGYRGDPELAGDNRWSHRHRFSPETFSEASAGSGPDGRVLSGLQALLELRRSLPPFPRTGSVTVLVNLSDRLALIERPQASYDVMRQEKWEASVLGPYEFRILAADP
jgi:amylosucrase